MPKVRAKPAPPTGLNATEKAELRALLDKVEHFEALSQGQPYQVEDPSAALVKALEYAFARGVTTGYAARSYGGGWFIASTIMSDLRRLVS